MRQLVFTTSFNNIGDNYSYIKKQALYNKIYIYKLIIQKHIKYFTDIVNNNYTIQYQKS